MTTSHGGVCHMNTKSLGSTLERARLAELILWDWRVMGIKMKNLDAPAVKRDK